jgi:hypothetical protein
MPMMPMTGKLTAKPHATKADFKAAGCTDDELVKIEAFIKANGINWASLWALVVQYGPTVIQFIISLLTPTPPPVVTP